MVPCRTSLKFICHWKNYPNALVEIANFLDQPDKGRKESEVNSLHKKNIGKEMRMNIHIGDYEADSVILDLGSDVNILTNHTWEKMGIPHLVWSHV